MGKRGNIHHKKDDRNSNDVQQNPRCSQPTIAVEDKLKFSPVVTIDYSCWSSAEKALLKNCVVTSPQINSQPLSSTTLRSRASPRKQSRTARGGDSPVTLKQNSESIPKANSKPVRKVLRRSPRKIIKALNLQEEVSRRRKASQRRVNRALGSVRKPRKPLDLSCPIRKSSRIKTSKIIIKRGKVTLRTLKMDSHYKKGDSNESPTSSETDQQQKGVASKADATTEDSDNDIEMQVLEKQVSSDKEDEDETNEDVSMNLPDDTDDESSLLSPSALPASSVFRSPSRRKLSARKQEQNAYTYNPSFRETPEPSTSSSAFHSSLSPSRRSEKRGRGRPRKPLEDVKSVSGKLYRKKLAERLADASINRTSVNIPRASASVQSTSASSHVITENFEDALEDEEDQGDQDDEHGDTSRKKLNRWNNRSTFVYAKHKFVSNENKFRCDTCQVSFTALSSLKRHYGTIYHKQQEAAGGPSTLDLSDILRPDRNNAMGSSPSNDSTAAGPSSRFTNGRGRPPQYGNVARTSSFVRRNAVDNIKKYYAAADAARRKRENQTNSTAPSAFTSWHQSKQQRRRRSRFNSELYSSPESDTNDFYEREGDHPFDLDEDVENSFPIENFSGQIPESKKWLSNSWKGVGPPHFTCEVCGEEYARKLDFTAHLFAHRQQEQVDEELTCSDCDTQFPNEASLDQHNKLLHHGGSSNGLQNQAKKFVCRRCGSVFPRPEYLEKHMLTHKRPKLRCPHCPKQFEFKFYLYDHIKAEHEALNTLANSNIIKPKMELLNASSSTSLPENRNRSRYMGSEDIFHTDQNTRRMMMVTHRRTKPVTSNANVQEYLAAHNENELKKGEGNPIHSTEKTNQHGITSSEHQPESVNMMQKFFDSQNSQKQSFSTDTNHAEMNVENEAVGMGQVGESDGNIVIQFGPMKHSIFDDCLDRPDTEGDGDTCLSPLTIEIPRHADGDKKDSEALQDGNNENGKLTYVSGGKSRVIVSTLQGPLLGCGVSYILPTKPPENALTCQDCGKTFEHRKSLVKHVQYYRQSEEYSCTICNKSFRLKHHVSRHMKSFHNIDTNSTTSSTSGDNADIHGDVDDPCEIDAMNSPSGSSSGGLLTSMGHSEVSGVSGTSFTRQFTSGDDTRKRNLSSVKSALSKIRSMSWKNMKKVEDPGDQSKKRLLHLGPSSTDKSNRMTKKFTKSKPSSVSSESSSASASGSGSIPDFNYEDNYTMVLDSNGAQAFKCLLCKKLYPSKHRLNSHLWYHKKASVFKCNVCSAEFKFKHDLNAHHQIHNVHRVRFKCEICPNKSFSWRKDLLKHLRTKHYVGGTPTESSSMEDKLSRCPFCPLVFPQDGDLSSHISEHHTKCVVCQECGQVVGSQELLNEHMEQEHDDEGGDPPTPSPHASPVHMQSFQQHEPSSPEFELLELN